MYQMSQMSHLARGKAVISYFGLTAFVQMIAVYDGSIVRRRPDRSSGGGPFFTASRIYRPRGGLRTVLFCFLHAYACSLTLSARKGGPSFVNCQHFQPFEVLPQSGVTGFPYKTRHFAPDRPIYRSPEVAGYASRLARSAPGPLCRRIVGSRGDEGPHSADCSHRPAPSIEAA